jgi:uncharacterized protein (TIGR00156 family)
MVMRKKLVCFGVMAAFVCMVGMVVSAEGFTGPSSVTVSRVSDVAQMLDDASVVLEGKIEQQLGDDKYVFSDESGTITVEIDDDAWLGLSIGADDVVIIYGEVDRGSQRIEVDVERIEKKIP